MIKKIDVVIAPGQEISIPDPDSRGIERRITVTVDQVNDTMFTYRDSTGKTRWNYCYRARPISPSA